MCQVCKNLFVLLLISFLISSCGVEENNNSTTHYKLVKEVKPVEIQLAEPFNSNDMEYSGLTTHDDKLILLPQYFLGFDKDTTGFIFSIDFNRIREYLNSINTSPIVPESIKVYASGFQRFNHRGSGYEAITFVGDEVFILIEDIGTPTKTYIAKGIYDDEENTVHFDSSTITQLPQQSYIRNYGYETLFTIGENTIAIQELNGKNNCNSRNAYEYTTSLNILKTFKLPIIEYRITDATIFENNSFYVINYFWPGDYDLLKPGKDLIAEKYGIGEHQSESKGIERILKMKIEGDSLIVAGKPIYILPYDSQSSNWEGIAKFDNGFILVTDTYPHTRLVYVEE